MRLALAVLAVLAGCAEPELPLPPPPPPMPVERCPGPVVVPPAPQAPRTLEQIVAYAMRLDAALVRSEAARAACARALEQARQGEIAWIR
jgi:hypothetical protein